MPRNRSKIRRFDGFTLIELMLVVAIVALLAAIAIPKFSNLIDKSREAAMKGNLATLRSALTLYYADNEGLYPKYHNAVAGCTGLILLHGKYVDFNQIVFRVPRYAGNYPARTAMDLYGDPMWAMSLNSKATVLPHLPPVHSSWPYPSYWNYVPVLWAAPLRASIKTYAIKPGGMDLLDTKGQAWSLW